MCTISTLRSSAARPSKASIRGTGVPLPSCTQMRSPGRTASTAHAALMTFWRNWAASFTLAPTSKWVYLNYIPD